MDVIDQTKGTKNKLNSMQYSTRMIKMGLVGFEPTTSAMLSVVRKELAQFLLGPPLAHLALSDATIITEEERGYFSSK